MYLMIMEDGSIFKINREPTQDDYNSSNDGYCDIININNPMNPKQWHNGWHELESA